MMNDRIQVIVHNPAYEEAFKSLNKRLNSLSKVVLLMCVCYIVVDAVMFTHVVLEDDEKKEKESSE